MDSSNSIGDDNYYRMLGVVKDIVKSIAMQSETGMRLGMLTFSTSAQTWFNLNSYQDTMMTMNMINFDHAKGTTNMAGALR